MSGYLTASREPWQISRIPLAHNEVQVLPACRTRPMIGGENGPRYVRYCSGLETCSKKMTDRQEAAVSPIVLGDRIIACPAKLLIQVLTQLEESE